MMINFFLYKYIHLFIFFHKSNVQQYSGMFFLGCCVSIGVLCSCWFYYHIFFILISSRFRAASLYFNLYCFWLSFITLCTIHIMYMIWSWDDSLHCFFSESARNESTLCCKCSLWKSTSIGVPYTHVGDPIWISISDEVQNEIGWIFFFEDLYIFSHFLVYRISYGSLLAIKGAPIDFLKDLSCMQTFYTHVQFILCYAR